MKQETRHTRQQHEDIVRKALLNQGGWATRRDLLHIHKVHHQSLDRIVTLWSTIGDQLIELTAEAEPGADAGAVFYGLLPVALDLPGAFRVPCVQFAAAYRAGNRSFVINEEIADALLHVIATSPSRRETQSAILKSRAGYKDPLLAALHLGWGRASEPSSTATSARANP